MYKIIDEKLRIASCSLADLTMEQVNRFLQQWEDGAPIGSLTVFYDDKQNLIVLNRDHKSYEYYLDVVIAYLRATEEQRKLILNQTPESMKETMCLLECVCKRINFQTDVDYARQNFANREQCECAMYIMGIMPDKRSAVMVALRYGIMCGKREERARRRKAQVK